MFFLFKIMRVKQYCYDPFATNGKEERNCIFTFITMYIISRLAKLHSALLIFDVKMRECERKKE